MTGAHLVGVDECGGQGEAVDEELGGDDAVMTTVGAGVLAEVLVQQFPRLVAAPEAATHKQHDCAVPTYSTDGAVQLLVAQHISFRM